MTSKPAWPLGKRMKSYQFFAEVAVIPLAASFAAGHGVLGGSA